MFNVLAIEKKQNLSVSKQSIATLFTIIGAVILPQAFHILGESSGYSINFGIVFSPMHLPIILAGFLAGPYVGAISGLLSPVVSYYWSGMPFASQLPFMMIELLTYGLVTGLIRYAKLPVVVKILIAQFCGRFMFMALSFFFALVLNNNKIDVLDIWKLLPKSLPAIILQLTIIPFILFVVKSVEPSEEATNDISEF